MSEDLISVVVTTYRRNDYLRQALESIESQTYDPIETVVIDGSDNGVAASVVPANVEYAHIPTDKPHAARSAGLEYAEGEYVHFLDDDDRFYPEKLSRQIEVFDANPTAGVVYTGLRTDSDDVILPATTKPTDALYQMMSFQGTPCVTSTMLIRWDVLKEVHPFENLHAADDIGMKIDLACRTQFAAVDEVLMTAGEPPGSLGTTWSAVEGRWKVLSRYEDLYDAAPPWVRQKAIAETHQKAGRRHLEARPWSLKAILAFAKALYYEPEPSLLHYGEFISSLGGRTGRRIAARVIER